MRIQVWFPLLGFRVYPRSTLQRKWERTGKVYSSDSDYHAFLLRLWREGARKPWRAELVSPHTGAKHHFTDQGQLLAFLAELTQAEAAVELPPQRTHLEAPGRGMSTRLDD